jgi:ubiquitin-protein ligase
MRSQIAVSQTLSMKRLVTDYLALKNSEIPLVGVAAIPDENNLLVWHINIRGQEGTLWQRGVFHMIMTFQKDYPLSPPKIILFTPLSHQNVHLKDRQRIVCLEQLTPKLTDQARWYEGWQSAYTVESILIQLQSFLSEKSLTTASPAEIEVAKQEVDTANAFKCKSCRHKGSIELNPKFAEPLPNEFI